MNDRAPSLDEGGGGGGGREIHNCAVDIKHDWQTTVYALFFLLFLDELFYSAEQKLEAE